MNKKIRFYAQLYSFFTREPKEDAVLTERMTAEILKLAEEAKVSWQVNKHLLDHMDANDGSLDIDLFPNLFAAAFKDLSPLRHPKAAQTLARVKALNVSFQANCYQLLWGQKIIEKTDGSATIVLHVSNLKDFRRSITRGLHSEQVEGESLEEGIKILVRS